jgi:glycosyltransferase involved in cell wall biosynthesis
MTRDATTQISLPVGAASETPLGVSIVICTHNGGKRLPQTLAHLGAQRVPKEINWEVLLIDNASTDDTAEVALRCWQGTTSARLRVIHEQRLGLNNARVRGLAEASQEVVSFVDDDNWVCSEWVSGLSDAMSSSPRLAAIAGLVLPKCEINPPPWFDCYKLSYAVFDENELNKFGAPPTYLYGAGLSIRKAAWNRLVEQGFRFHVSDRRGANLDAHGDVELTLRLQAGGWDLAIDPRLSLEHFLPASRLTWEYLRRLTRANAASFVPLEAYFYLPDASAGGRRGWLRRYWLSRAIVAGLRVFPFLPTLLTAGKPFREGRQEVLEAEQKLGRFYGLLRLRSKYTTIRREAEQARDSINVVRQMPFSTPAVTSCEISMERIPKTPTPMAKVRTTGSNLGEAYRPRARSRK